MEDCVVAVVEAQAKAVAVVSVAAEAEVAVHSAIRLVRKILLYAQTASLHRRHRLIYRDAHFRINHLN